MKNLVDFLLETQDLEKAIKDKEDVEKLKQSFNSYFPTYELVDVVNKLKGNKANLDKIDWGAYLEADDFNDYDAVLELVKENILELSSIVKSADIKECGYVDDLNDFTGDEELRDMVDIKEKDCGFVVQQDGDDEYAGIFIIKGNKINSKMEKIIENFFYMFEYIEWQYFNALTN